MGKGGAVNQKDPVFQTGSFQIFWTRKYLCEKYRKSVKLFMSSGELRSRNRLESPASQIVLRQHENILGLFTAQLKCVNAY